MKIHSRWLGAVRTVGIVVAVLIAGTFAPVPVTANELDDARSAGIIGERPDGLVGVVGESAPANIVALVQSVNSARMNSYRSLASQEGTNVETVQAVAGERQIEKAVQNGWYVMDANGTWRKR